MSSFFFFRRLGLIIAVGLAPLHAQLFIITGEVTDVEGTFVGQFTNGDRVQVNLDISPPLEEVFIPPPHPDSAEFLVPVRFTIGGNSLLPDRSLGNVILLSPAPDGAGFPKADGMAVHLWRNAGSTHVGSVSLLTPFDVISKPVFLPSGLAMEAFTWARHGVYYSSVGDGTFGSLRWTVTGYDNQTPPFSAVPEPGTFALFSAIGLIALIAFRRRISGASCTT